jgi:2-methylisocitrate lyase-like PEP mutase family enzyme
LTQPVFTPLTAEKQIIKDMNDQIQDIQTEESQQNVTTNKRRMNTEQLVAKQVKHHLTKVEKKYYST